MDRVFLPRRQEHEGILCGRNGFGDLPSCFRATDKHVASKPRHNGAPDNVPDVKIPKPATRKVTSLAAVAAYHEAVAAMPDKPETKIVMPIETEARKLACDIGEVFRIQRDFWRKLGAPRGGDVRVKA